MKYEYLKPIIELGAFIQTIDPKTEVNIIDSNGTMLYNGTIAIILKDEYGNYDSLNERYVESIQIHPPGFTGDCNIRLYPSPISHELKEKISKCYVNITLKDLISSFGPDERVLITDTRTNEILYDGTPLYLMKIWELNVNDDDVIYGAQYRQIFYIRTIQSTTSFWIEIYVKDEPKFD